MKFTEGVSGNPNGRPRGAKNKRTIFEEAVLQHQDELMNKAIEMAKQGNEQMLKLILERLLPAKPKDNPLPFIEMDNSSLGNLADSINKAVYEGEITPIEGLSLTQLLKAKIELVEVEELSERINDLEMKFKTKGANKC